MEVSGGGVADGARNATLQLYVEKWISNCFVKCFF